MNIFVSYLIEIFLFFIKKTCWIINYFDHLQNRANNYAYLDSCVMKYLFLLRVLNIVLSWISNTVFILKQKYFVWIHFVPLSCLDILSSFSSSSVNIILIWLQAAAHSSKNRNIKINNQGKISGPPKMFENENKCKMNCTH